MPKPHSLFLLQNSLVSSGKYVAFYITWYRCISPDKSCTAAVSVIKGAAHRILITTTQIMYHVGLSTHG